MAGIKGTAVTLYDLVQTGEDGFHAPVYQEAAVSVENVLICPASTEAVTEGIQVYGKRAVYELCIPKGDSHVWEDRTVEFWGRRWRTFGFPLEWMAENTPGSWNRKVMVEAYG